MKEWIKKWYVLFVMMRISIHNKERIKFEKKYEDVFYRYGQDTTCMTIEKCTEKNGKLFKVDKNKIQHEVASEPQKDDFGLYEYVDPHYRYCEDDFYGTIYTKTPIKGLWVERGFNY